MYCGKAKLKDKDSCFKLYLKTYLKLELDEELYQKGEINGCEFAEIARAGYL